MLGLIYYFNFLKYDNNQYITPFSAFPPSFINNDNRFSNLFKIPLAILKTNLKIGSVSKRVSKEIVHDSCLNLKGCFFKKLSLFSSWFRSNCYEIKIFYFDNMVFKTGISSNTKERIS